MTQITTSEVKIVFFALFFIALLSAWMGIYYQDPITNIQYGGNTSVTSTTTSADSDSWISGLIGSLPAPFNTTVSLLIGSVILIPVVVMLGYISIRAIKDLISQWI